MTFLTWCPVCGDELQYTHWKRCPDCADEVCVTCYAEHMENEHGKTVRGTPLPENDDD